MENLAYIYVAQAYASPEETIPSLDGAGIWRLLAGLKPSRLSNLAWFRWLAIAQSLWILGFAGEAIAALQRGDRGAPVSCVQGILKRDGYYHGPIDGVYGSQTEAAVRDYERDRSGRKRDGKLKNETVAKMGCASVSTKPLPRPRAVPFSDFTEPLPRPRAVPFSNPTEPLPRPRGALLSVGCSSEAVTDLQLALKAKGYFDSPITGYYGPLTESAVMQFQKAYGLAVDGIAGPRTVAAMQGSVAPTLVTRRI